MNRVKVNLKSISDVIAFSNRLNEDKDGEYMFENKDGSKRADTKTYLGCAYALLEFDEIYLVNEKPGGELPEFIEKDTLL